MKDKIELKSQGPPVGYNPIAEIRGAMFHWVCVPFNSHVVGSSPIWCYLTCLNSIQIQSCGDLSCLYFPEKENENKKEKSLDELIDIRNAQEALVKLTLIRPTFDEIISMITKSNFNVSEKKAELDKINKLINSESEKEKSNKKEIRKLQRLAEKVEFYLGFLLPDDTMNFIASWALGLQITDIKKLSRDMLLQAAIMAVNGHKDPTDYLSGIFTDFQKIDISKHAWCIYNKYMEDKKREKDLRKNNYKWG